IVQSPSKKRKVSNTAIGETTKGKRTVPVQPSSFQAVPAALKGDSSPAWDPLLNPMEFIEKVVSIMGNLSSLGSVSTEE
ncbi:hypothetical protein A2U01_0095126, partial [Trifolium medium]|nr:hypothetical protein [Trifolium medium]